jgi:hypothetical protein
MVLTKGAGPALASAGVEAGRVVGTGERDRQPLKAHSHKTQTIRAELSERRVFLLRLRAEHGIDADRALRRILKFALRVCRMRCISAEEEVQQP